MAKKAKPGKKPNAKYAPTHYSREQKRRSGRTRRVLFFVAVVAVVVLTVFLLLPRSDGQISIAENALGTLITPVQNVISQATKGLRDFVSTWRSYDNLKNEYEAMTKDYDQLRLQYDSMVETEQENLRLTELLNAKDTYEALDPVYGKVIARDAGRWFNTFSINKGTSAGVGVGMAVVSGDGLIGHVYAVGINYAKVISVIDSRSSVAVLVQRTRDNGVMRGQVTTSADSSDCYLYYLPNVNNIQPGDKVITSGTDSQYVKGLTVGIITAVSVSESSEGGYAIVSPCADFEHVEEVFVLRQVVESASDKLPAMATPTPGAATSAPGASPTPEPTPTPNPNQYQYPSAGSIGSGTAIEDLPEDVWVEN